MDKERKLSDLKFDKYMATGYHFAMVSFAVVSSSAIVSSLPLAVLDILPTWADIALAGGGALLAPGSIHGVPDTKNWMDDAKKALSDFESNQDQL